MGVLIGYILNLLKFIFYLIIVSVIVFFIFSCIESKVKAIQSIERFDYTFVAVGIDRIVVLDIDNSHIELQNGLTALMDEKPDDVSNIVALSVVLDYIGIQGYRLVHLQNSESGTLLILESKLNLQLPPETNSSWQR